MKQIFNGGGVGNLLPSSFVGWLWGLAKAVNDILYRLLTLAKRPSWNDKLGICFALLITFFIILFIYFWFLGIPTEFFLLQHYIALRSLQLMDCFV